MIFIDAQVFHLKFDLIGKPIRIVSIKIKTVLPIRCRAPRVLLIWIYSFCHQLRIQSQNSNQL